MASVAFKAIKPKDLNSKAMRQALAKGLERFIKKPQKEFEATVATWEHGVEFPIEDQSSGNKLARFVGTDDPIYAYVNDGTEPHIIRPKAGTVLAFPTGYKAKTSPGRIGSNSGGASGATVFSKAVRHPGSKGREFDKAIAEKWQPKFDNEMEDVMRDAQRESEHAL